MNPIANLLALLTRMKNDLAVKFASSADKTLKVAAQITVLTWLNFVQIIALKPLQIEFLLVIQLQRESNSTLVNAVNEIEMFETNIDIF